MFAAGREFKGIACRGELGRLEDWASEEVMAVTSLRWG